MTDLPAFRAILDADLFRRAAICASTEETRYYLNGVYVEACPAGGAILAATDGHRLIVIRDPEGLVEGENAIIRLSQDMLKACAKKPDKVEGGPRKLIVENDSAKVNSMASGFAFGPPSDEGTIAYQWCDARIDGSFPDFRRVIPNIKGPTAAAPGFNAEYLYSFAAALGADKRAPLKVVVGADVQSPALVFAEHMMVDGFGVIMPMRMGDRVSVPSWVARSDATERKAA